jgi:hypothetical protein
VKEITRKYPAGAIERVYTIDEGVYEVNLFLVMTVEQLTLPTELNVGGLPAGILIQVAQVN